MFILGREILNLIKAKYSVVPSRQRTLKNIVNVRLQRPPIIMAGARILDEDPVGVIDAYLVDLLEHDARTKRITATDLADVMPATEHLGDELVAREQKGQRTRVVAPDLISHHSEGSKAARIFQFDRTRILWLSCRIAY